MTINTIVVRGELEHKYYGYYSETKGKIHIIVWYSDRTKHTN